MQSPGQWRLFMGLILHCPEYGREPEHQRRRCSSLHFQRTGHLEATTPSPGAAHTGSHICLCNLSVATW